MTSSSTTTRPLPAPFRQDAGVIGLVGLAHMVSHFSQLLLAPLFPWLKDVFQVSYAELGFLMTIFFVVSCAVQASSGFVVDRFGPRPILFAGLALLGTAAMGFAASTSYGMLAAFSVVAGIGNGVFHPVDYTLLNRKVSGPRLGHAYSVHGITGSLGWALAPAMLVPLAMAFSWRVALVAAGTLAFVVLAVVWLHRDKLDLPQAPVAPVRKGAAAAPEEGKFDFLRIPAVWMCFAFFFFYAMSLSVVQTFAPAAAAHLHDVPAAWVAMCLTVYMLASAGGIGIAASIALVMGLADVPGAMVPVLFGAMGFSAGIAGPSRDLLVKRSTPENATGRVYGVVYSGLDIGQAFAPLVFGQLMDRGQFQSVWIGLAIVQGVLIASAFNVRRVRRTALVAA